MSNPLKRGNRPHRIGGYEVLRKIATGGMANLFLAKRMGLDGFEKVVAIKQILSHLSHEEEFVNMFRDEARIIAKLSHPNIVQIYDLGKSDDSYFIAMEYIPGRNLSSVAKRAKAKNLTLDSVYIARSMAQACEGLYYAHNRKEPDGKPLHIVHRDVSPQNIILAFSGQVKIVDFGIAKAATKIAHTRHGVLKGKYAYMSPEQIRGEQIDARSDLFAVGVVLYELLCGKRPFDKDNSIQTLKAIVQDPHEDPLVANPNLDAIVGGIINRCLVKSRDQRYQTAQEIQIALEDYVAGSGKRATNLAISQWLNELFAEELRKPNGGPIVFKGVGEVILPQEGANLNTSSLPQSEPKKEPSSGLGPIAPSVKRDALKGKVQIRPNMPSIPASGESQRPPAEPSRGWGVGNPEARPPIQAPSTKQAPDRRASSMGGARAKLIQEVVINESLKKRPDIEPERSDDATAIVPPEFFDDTAEQQGSSIEVVPETMAAPSALPPKRCYSEGVRPGISEPVNDSAYDDGATEFNASLIDEDLCNEVANSPTRQALSSDESLKSRIGKTGIKAALQKEQSESPEEIAARITEIRAAGRAIAPGVVIEDDPVNEELEEIQVLNTPAQSKISEENVDTTGANPIAEPELPRPEMANVDAEADARTMATADYEAFEAELAKREQAKKRLFPPAAESSPVSEDLFEAELSAPSDELKHSASKSQSEAPKSSWAQASTDYCNEEEDTSALPSLRKPVVPTPWTSSGGETDTLPPGTPSSASNLVPPASKSTPSDVMYEIGSSQVPPANVSLSEILCEPSAPLIPARKPTPPYPGNIQKGMPALESEAPVLPAPELPPKSTSIFGMSTEAVRSCISGAKKLRSIKETNRHDSNVTEQPSQLAQIQLNSSTSESSEKPGPLSRMAGAGTGAIINDRDMSNSAADRSFFKHILWIAQVVIFTLAFLCVAGGVTYTLLKLRVPTLTIVTVPPGARVFMDGKLLEGSTPIDTEVTPGKKYELKIISEGYEEVRQRIKVRDSVAPSLLRIELKRNPAISVPPS